MPITVEVPGVGLIDFEDDFTEDQISQALAAEPWKAIPAPAPSRALAVPPINPDAPEAPPFAPSPGPEYNPMREIDRAAGWINRNVVDPLLHPLSTIEHGIEGIASLATGKDMRFLASPSEALRVPAISPETVKFFSPLGKTKEGTIAKGVEKFASEFISGLTSPEMGFALATAKIFPEIVGRVFQAQMATSIPAATETLWHSIRDRAETPDQVVNALNLLASAGMPVAIEMGLRKHAMREFPNLKIEGDYARQIKTPAEVYGDVRPQPVESVQKVPVEESGPRVQLPEESEAGVIPEPSQPKPPPAETEWATFVKSLDKLTPLERERAINNLKDATPEELSRWMAKLFQVQLRRGVEEPVKESVPVKTALPAESEVITTSGQAGVKPPPVEEAKPAGAQPWQMRQSAFVSENVDPKLRKQKSQFALLGRVESALRIRHRTETEQAIREGKPVPPEVLADYPDLAPTPQPPAKPAAKEAVAPVAEAKMRAGAESVNQAAAESTKATEAWGKHHVEVVEPLRQQIRKLNQDVQQMAGDARRTRPETKGKQRLTKKAFLEMYEVASMDEANALYKRKLADWDAKGKELEVAEQKLKELSDAKEKRVKEWSAAVTRSKEPEPARTTAGEGQAAETKLAQIVNDTIEQSTSPTKLGITPAGSSRPTDVVLGATDLKSVSPRAEARWQESVREKPSLLARLQDAAVNAWHSITREYADLPPREFPEQIDILRRLRASRNASARRTVDVLRGITHNLGPKQYGVFNRVVVLEDLLKDVESGKYADGRELPSGHANAAELTADLNKFKGIAEATPEIAAALARRGEFMNSLRETLVERGFLPETVLQDSRYFHHQVLMYLAAAKSGGAKSFRDWFSGWQKARVGSSKAYNRQYVEAEGEVIADAFNKMTMQDLQGQMKGASDLTAELRQLHGDEWASHVPQNYTRWQPKRGNVFYPVKTVAERVMEEYLDGLRDILPEEFKDAVAIGRKREEWIIPKELAKVLDNLAPRKDTWIERLAGAGIGAWKRYILLNPLRAMKYQVNNTSGDVDFVFAANPRIFKEFKQAAIDSYAFHKKGKAATGDVKEAIDLGVVQSGWRASEIPDIGGSEYFNWLTGSKPGVVDRYWKWIGKWNDAREDTARLATYRFALKEWDANKPFYGASVPKDVAALPTNKLKAAKVARELLIDYGRETEFGEFMRRKAVPFYRWMHGNFARYVQLVRNIPVQEGAGGARLASVGAKRAAAKGGALAVRGAFAYMAINLWNNLFFPDEEEALGDTRNQLHLILGRDEQGNIQTIRFQGALSDLLGWVGLDNLPQDAEDLFRGKASLGDKMEEGFEAGVSRAVNATSPFYKTAGEAMTGRSLYPNALEPRPIRDKAEHVAGLFSLKNVYQWIAGKPHKSMRRELSGLLTYTIDPGEAAYNATRHMAAEWMEDRGEERSQTIPGKRANALYYYKQALRYKDAKLAAKFKAEYEAMGGKQEGLNASVQRSAPLASLGKKQSEFLKSLSPAEKAVVDRAQKWYQQVYR